MFSFQEKIFAARARLPQKPVDIKYPGIIVGGAPSRRMRVKKNSKVKDEKTSFTPLPRF
jgi:hypothetical protein